MGFYNSSDKIEVNSFGSTRMCVLIVCTSMDFENRGEAENNRSHPLDL